MIISVRMTFAEAKALLTVANYALLDGEAPLKKERPKAEMALKRLVTQMGHVPHMEAGMIKMGRKA